MAKLQENSTIMKSTGEEVIATKKEVDNVVGKLSNLKTNEKSSIVKAINEVFTSVSNGKQVIATAITDMGKKASGSDSFQQLANLIRAIETGDYNIGDTLQSSQFVLLEPKVLWSVADVITYCLGPNDFLFVGTKFGDGSRGIRKLDPNGKEIWRFTGIDGLHSLNDVAVDNKGNSYCQIHEDDSRIVKLDPNGNELWTYTVSYDSLFPPIFFGFAVGSENHVYFNVFGGENCIIRLDSDGKEVWRIESKDDVFITDNNNNVLVRGDDKNSIIKLDPNGKEIWRFADDKISFYDIATIDNENSLYISCVINDSHSLIKLDTNGNEVFRRTGLDYRIMAIDVDDDKNMYIGYEDSLIKKISNKGEEIWKFTRHRFTLHKGIVLDSRGDIYTKGGGDLMKISGTEMGNKIDMPIKIVS